MTNIQSDTEFKAALSAMSVTEQRQVGRLFVEHVIGLSDNPAVGKTLMAGDIAGLTDDEIASAYKTTRSAAIESYTLCGHDGDWIKQASHFVASAAAACFTPADQAVKCNDIAWSAAMNARMAKVCESVAHSTGNDDSEARSQYGILTSFLQAV